MKRIVRKGVFESNSSSCHSLQIVTGNFEEQNLIVDDFENKVIVQFGEFGWGFYKYDDPLTKLSYLLTMLIECNSDCKSLESFYELEEFEKLNSMIACHCNCDGIKIDSKISACKWDERYNDHDGYIDHQSMFSSVNDFLEYYSVSAEEFIFNPAIELIIADDNWDYDEDMITE